jgi:hypothetical protein
MGSDSRRIIHMMKLLLINLLEIETDKNLDCTQQNRNRKMKDATKKRNRKAKHRRGVEFDAKTNLNIRCNLKYYSKSDAQSYIRVRASHVRWINFQSTNHLDKLHSKLRLPLQRTDTFTGNNKKAKFLTL